MKERDHAMTVATLVAVEQYITSLIFAIMNPGHNGPLEAARANLIDKVEAFMKEADKRG